MEKSKNYIKILLWIWFILVTFLSITNFVNIIKMGYDNGNLQNDILMIRKYLMQNSKIKLQ
jgi:hypothetical protein